jgi:adenine-specific DNA-methyltransferase
MVKTDLTEEEKKLIIEALNNNIEPPSELMTKLFPGLAEKFDVAKLDRAKVVTLEYAGKRSEAAILNQGSPTDAGSPLQVERCFKGGSLTGETQLDLFERAKYGTDDNWQNLIVQGDNLQFLKTCHRNADPLIKDRVKDKVKIVYIDPPFATKSDFKGSKDEKSYSDKVDSAEFIEGLRERLICLREILADDGVMYLHLDERMNHYLRVIMDEVFGRENFQNGIVWQRTNAHNMPTKAYVRITDMILFYAKDTSFTFNKQYGEYSKAQLKRYKLDESRRLYTGRDLTFSTVNPSRQFEWRGTKPPRNRSWGFPKENLEKLWNEGRILKKKDGAPRLDGLKVFLDETKGSPITNIWDDIVRIGNTSNERIDYPTVESHFK